MKIQNTQRFPRYLALKLTEEARDCDNAVGNLLLGLCLGQRLAVGEHHGNQNLRAQEALALLDLDGATLLILYDLVGEIVRAVRLQDFGFEALSQKLTCVCHGLVRLDECGVAELPFCVLESKHVWTLALGCLVEHDLNLCHR